MNSVGAQTDRPEVGFLYAAIYTVTGILQDVPANTDFPLKVVISYSSLKNVNVTGWEGVYGRAYTFVRLPRGLPASRFNILLHDFVSRHTAAGLGPRGIVLEIGVRKVLGASVMQVMVLLSRAFTVLIGIAFLVVAPAAYYLMHRWLDGFAYRIHLGAGLFLLSVLVSVVIAWCTVGYRAFRAAVANPAAALRSE